jgi:hypothetical protein
MAYLGLSKPDNDAGSSLSAVVIGFFVAFGGVLFGFVVPPASRHLV